MDEPLPGGDDTPPPAESGPGEITVRVPIDMPPRMVDRVREAIRDTDPGLAVTAVPVDSPAWAALTGDAENGYDAYGPYGSDQDARSNHAGAWVLQVAGP